MKLELFAPTERYPTGASHCTHLVSWDGQKRPWKIDQNHKYHHHPSGSESPNKIIDFWIKSPNIIINVDVCGFLLGVDLFFRAAYHMSSRSRSELVGVGLRSSPGAPSRENEMSHLKWYRRTRDSWQSAILETRCIFEALSRSCGTMSVFQKHLQLFFRRPWKIWVCLKMSCTPLYPMVLLIIIPIKNGYFIGGIAHFQTYEAPWCTMYGPMQTSTMECKWMQYLPFYVIIF